MTELSRKPVLEKLKPRREPYWMCLSKGQYLGFRRGPDTWQVRMRDRTGKQVYNALTECTNYDEAKKAAEVWLQQMGNKPVRKAVRGNVRDALEAYLAYLRTKGRHATAKTIEPKFKQVVWDDPLAIIRLRTLVLDDTTEWRERLRDGRQPRSINRIVRDVKAGLNRALVLGHVGNPQAWALDPLEDDMDEGGEAAIILAPRQRKALIDNALPQAAVFLRGLELTGARPGELAAATVADFDRKPGTLRLMHRKGRPAKLRPRSVVLSGQGAVFFAKQAKGKLPAARLFLAPNGYPWEAKKWAEEIRAAAAIVNARAKGKNRIPPGASAYGFRHARISELLQVHGVDALTVAAQTGTSLRMIERYYLRFIPQALRDKLAAVDEG